MTILKHIGRVLLIILLLTIVLVAGAYGILQTGFGKEKLVAIVNSNLRSADSTIVISGLDGSIPLAPTLSSVSISDNKGEWLKISGIKLRWNVSTSPLNIYIENIEAAKIDILRSPESTEENNEPWEFKLPELPRVYVKRISLPQVNLAESFTGQKQVIEVKGSLRTYYDKMSEATSLEAKTLVGTPLNLAINVKQDSFAISLNEDAGGVIGRLADMISEESLTARINGNGVFPSGKGEVLIKTSASDVLYAAYEVQGSDESLSLKLNANLNLPDTEFYNDARNIAGDEITLDIDFDANKQGAINIKQAKINSANINLDLNGMYTQSAVDLQYSANIINLMPIANQPGFMKLEGKAQGKVDNLSIIGKAEGDVAEFKSFSLDYDVIGKNDNWQVNQFGLDTDGLNAKISGNVNTSSNELDLNFAANIIKLEKFSDGMGGTVTASGAAKGDFEDVDFHINAEGANLAGLPPQVAGLIGKKLTFIARGAAGSQGNVKLDEFMLTGANIAAQGTAEVNEERIKADFTAKIPDTTKVEPSLKGSLIANVNIDGSADAAAGKFNATLTSRGQKLDAGSNFAINGDILSLNTISAKTKGINIYGNAVVNTKTSLADSKFNIDAPDLSGLQAFTAQKISGSGKAVVITTAQNNAQSIDANGSFQSVSVDDLKIGTARFKAKTSDLKNLVGLDAELNATDITSGENVVEKLDFTAQGKKQLVEWELHANMTQPEPAKISSAGSMAANMPNWELKLNSLDANYGSYIAKLNSPATIKKTSGIIDIANLVLNVNEAIIAASGQYSPAKVDLKLTASEVKLGRFTEGKLRGNAKADITITGSATKPEVKLNANLDRISTEDTGRIPLTVKADANISSGRLIANIQALQDSGHITANAEIPVKLSLEPFVFELAETSPIIGGALVDLNLADIANILLPSDQLLSGSMKGNLSFGGTLASPTGSGQINLANARYENFSTGTVLENMQAAISTDGKMIILSGFNARAGEGSVTANGSAGLTAPYDIKAGVVLNNAGLVNMQEASGLINGNLELTGNSKEQFVNGKIILGAMEINIPEETGVNVAEVKILNPEVLPRQKWQKVESVKPKEPSVIKLDIEVSAPSQVFVHGRGLETEMRGELKVTGTSSTPEVRGKLYTVRGTYSFLDRDLKLKECVLDFRGAVPPSPYLNIIAETQAKDTIVGVNLTGSVNAPVLKLTSTPALPEDEILAQLLFGRDIKSITPMQGAQLIQALNSLRGGGTGFDPVGNIRKAIGVDKLDVDADEGGNVTVGAGKYVTDKIYLGVEGGAGEGSGKVKAEIEATDNISVEAESGASSNGVRLNWKYDY